MIAPRTLPRNSKQNDRDQDHALGQIVQHRVRGEVHQVGAVEEGARSYALGQDLRVQLACTLS